MKVRPSFCLIGATFLGYTLITSCAFRLPAPNIPSQERLRVVTDHPEHYIIRVAAYHDSEFPVETDGRVTFAVPRLPRACSIYLFDRIKIRGGVSPFTTKAIRLFHRDMIVKALSLAEIEQLPTDRSGFHIVKVN